MVWAQQLNKGSAGEGSGKCASADLSDTRLSGSVPGGEYLQLVVGEVKHPEVAVSRQQRDALVREAVVGHVELLEAAEAVLR